MALADSAPGSVKRHAAIGTGHSSRMDCGHSDGLSHELGHMTSHHHHYSHEWEAKEELRMRELEEARARAAQMEKTMRWWCDCTANWREKWSKVRTERNKVREEVRLLRTKLEAATKENNEMKREKLELEVELERYRGKSHQHDHGKGSHGSSPCSIHSVPERDVSMPKLEQEKNSIGSKSTNESTRGFRELSAFSDEQDQVKALLQSSNSPCPVQDRLTAPHPSPDMEFFDRLLQSSDDQVTKPDNDTLGRSLSRLHSLSKGRCKPQPQGHLWEEISTPDIEFVEQRLAELQLRLDEATKTVQAEREEKISLNKHLEKMQQDCNDMRLKYDELKMSKHDTLKELSQVKAAHQDELDSIRMDLEDEANSRSSMDRRLGDLRAQLERLQVENAAEWGKRERLETEKLSLERENKKLRSQIEELEERLERKTKGTSGGGEADSRTIQHELQDKNKELVDLRHSHNKLKKVLQEKTTELAHAIRRAEQYETEVKKLRCRVEELKKELATAEDEVDSSTNNIRKLQRTNDELQEQVDSLQVQVDHLQTRLRSNSHSLLALRGSNSLLHDGLSEDDNAEF